MIRLYTCYTFCNEKNQTKENIVNQYIPYLRTVFSNLFIYILVDNTKRMASRSIYKFMIFVKRVFLLRFCIS
jgi:hypothetical protein